MGTHRIIRWVAAAGLASTALVGTAASPATAASEGQYASAWSSPNSALWTPQPPSANVLGPTEASTLCASTSGSPGGAIAFFTFPAFSIPAGDVIQGIEVKPRYRTNDSHFLQLTDGGVLIGSQKTLPLNFPGMSNCDSTSVVTVGGPMDLWGTGGLMPADFNAGDIGVRLLEKVGGGTDPGNAIPINVESIQLVVHHGPVNVAPTADAGGPYNVNEGGSVVLSGAGSTDPDSDPLTYAWDLDNDGAFDDATGVSPSFSAVGRNGLDTQTIRLRVNDGTVDSAPDSATVNILNVAPIITFISVSPSSIDEGQAVTVNGGFTDPAAAQETHTGAALWSDGVSTPVTVGDSTFSTSRLFPDDHPLTGTAQDAFTVAITIDDGDGGSDTATSPIVTVQNVAPTIDPVNVSATSIDEGDSVTVSGTYTDPALGVGTETFSGSALWSDGSSTPLVVGAGTFSTVRAFTDDDPTVTPSDDFTVDISIGDDDLGSDTKTSPTITVNNVDPVLGPLTVTPMIDEDGTVSLSGSFTDVGVDDTHTVSVDWGEGLPEPATVVQAAGSGTFSATHQYLDDDPTASPQDTSTITVTVTDDDSGTDSGTVDTIVKNVDPVVTSVASDATFADKANEGEVVNVTGTFTDVGTLDTHTASIDWGDGNVTPGVVVQGAGSGSFSGSHAYTTGGVFTVTVTVTDDDTGTATDSTLAVVTGVGINAGVLQVVGTNDDDHVEVKRIKDEIDVFADFVSPKHRRYDHAAVSSIEIWLCDGDDHGNVHQSIELPASIHGGADDDMLWGGSAADFVEGGDGDDKIWGRNGDDVLHGDAGDDSLTGGKGTDVLDGGSGNNKLKQ
ncbi:MAG: hypothetical protein HKN44_09000 [Ilumatobacter sp.]|nr:hypothetical protein [Ilumatobacter sp.]